jgi:hypothetical protein
VRQRLAGDELESRDRLSRSSIPFAFGEMTWHAGTGRHAGVPAFEVESSERFLTGHLAGEGQMAASGTPGEGLGQAPT